MSLRAIFDEEKTRRIKEVMPDALIVYKVALTAKKEDVHSSYSGHYFAPFVKIKYMGGEQLARTDRGVLSAPVIDCPSKRICYHTGFFSFVKKSVAETYMNLLLFRINLPRYRNYTPVLLTSGIRNEWISAIGTEEGRNLIAVSTRIVIPSYPYRDLREDPDCVSFFEDQWWSNATADLKTNAADRPAGLELLYRQKRKHRELR